MTEQEQKSDRDDLAFEIKVVETNDKYVILRIYFRSDLSLNYVDDVRMVKGQKLKIWDNQLKNESNVGYVAVPKVFAQVDLNINVNDKNLLRKELKDE